MKGISNNYYFILLSIGIGLLLFVFYFTRVRCNLTEQSNATGRKTNEAINAYEELSDDYKSAVIIYASTGLVSAKYLEMYSGDAHDILPDVELIKLSAEDIESAKRADTLERQLTIQSKWILDPSIETDHKSNSKDNELKQFFDTKAIIERGEAHVRQLAVNHKEELKKSFSSIYQWLLILISASASLIIIVVMAILWHIRKGKRNLQKIGLQKDRLDEIAWIQSHKVRSHVATILGLAQLFNYSDPGDENNRFVLEGFKEATEKLDAVIKEIDSKTRIEEGSGPKIVRRRMAPHG